MTLSPDEALSVRIKAAKLRLASQYEESQKTAFVASPQTTQNVQQQAQQTGTQPNQGSPTQAVTPQGVTLDEVVQMMDQFYAETIQGIQQIQTLVTQVQTMMPTGGGDGKGDSQNFKALNDRLMKIEQMVAGASGGTASPADQAAAQAPPLPSPGEGNAQGAGQAPPGQAPIGGGAPMPQQ